MVVAGNIGKVADSFSVHSLMTSALFSFMNSMSAIKYRGGVSSVNPCSEVSWILCLPVSDVPCIHLSALVDVASPFLSLGA